MSLRDAGLVLAAVLALLDWTALWHNWRRAEYITKPVVILALLAWFTLRGGWQDISFWFGVALIFSLIGDVFLLWKGAFLAGLLSFLAAHVCITVALNPSPIPLTPVSAALTVIVWLAAMLFFRRLQAAVRAKEGIALLQLPLLVYTLALSVMLLSALATLARPEWPPSAAVLTAAGGLLFAFSDGLLAYNRFIQRVPRGRFWVRIPYHVGQFALTVGLVLRYAG